MLDVANFTEAEKLSSCCAFRLMESSVFVVVGRFGGRGLLRLFWWAGASTPMVDGGLRKVGI